MSREEPDRASPFVLLAFCCCWCTVHTHPSIHPSIHPSTLSLILIQPLLFAHILLQFARAVRSRSAELHESASEDEDAEAAAARGRAAVDSYEAAAVRFSHRFECFGHINAPPCRNYADFCAEGGVVVGKAALRAATEAAAAPAEPGAAVEGARERARERTPPARRGQRHQKPTPRRRMQGSGGGSSHRRWRRRRSRRRRAP